MSIRIESISKSFSAYPALKGVTLDIGEGEFVALLGPSGSGKTTLLRIIAGLEFPDEGKIVFSGKDVTDTPAAQRGIGFVFQHYALFGHMNVARNIAFGLDIMKRRELLRHLRSHGCASHDTIHAPQLLCWYGGSENEHVVLFLQLND